jgi:hypothetical protein
MALANFGRISAPRDQVLPHPHHRHIPLDDPLRRARPTILALIIVAVP